ncbi:3-hydroxyacyl-CoA dehydrogenase family protein [Chitinophaga cymbidii]|uniref:3-hydroxyacyl-CoA dehydrogenase C-terminal domain-containing protein n=1 Tax=Chitinophaga cymbidii TaxID=1096750 RepID=A0A512RHY8_9BACT|nr:3-hydroxyacyl-CoA dehydrogenase family protein [Chitinophaga cymbidii]GEP95315.1 hypothetical protein CCY01nite_15750 [Chitinophaga cymbidii]
MRILITGETSRQEELRSSRDFGSHELIWSPGFVPGTELVIDLSLDEHPERLVLYAAQPDVPVLGCMVKNVYDQPGVYGCNWLPGFLGMPRLEVAATPSADLAKLDALMQQLGWLYETVAATPGLVTPRVVCMIINEAYFTAAEGTATRDDIDISMKLGTNYPAGPFEWSRKIGIRHVYEVLQAVHACTGNERYRACSMLQEEYTANKKSAELGTDPSY